MIGFLSNGICLMFFLIIRLKLWVLRMKLRGKIPFLSIVPRAHPHDLYYWCWLWLCDWGNVRQVSPLWNSSQSTLHTWLFRRQSPRTARTWEMGSDSPSSWRWSVHMDNFEYFSLKFFSLSPIYKFIQTLFMPIWTHGYLFILWIII